jgi:hypothetical protein
MIQIQCSLLSQSTPTTTATSGTGDIPISCQDQEQHRFSFLRSYLLRQQFSRLFKLSATQNEL